MKQVAPRVRTYGRIAAVLLVIALASTGARAAGLASSDRTGEAGTRSDSASGAEHASTDRAAAVVGGDTLFGRSGKLRVRFLAQAARELGFPMLARLFGDSASARPGVYALPDSLLGGRNFSFITLRPFSDKLSGRIGSYRIGSWPAERRRVENPAYRNPDGFIEVTPENQNTRVSEHFQLRDFLTHDQQDIWPKYLVLRVDLVDKLELVIGELERRGIPVQHLAVMSGFRTPQYNRTGGDPRGRAELSRHMYGDAADVFVDNDRDGRMDDLNRDGRIDAGDAKVILGAVERVEQLFPDLTGGVGVYRASRAHGPFAHVDVRGFRARWGAS